jgi:hypothetical protein
MQPLTQLNSKSRSAGSALSVTRRVRGCPERRNLVGAEREHKGVRRRVIAAAGGPVLPPLWSEDAGRELVPVASGDG